MSKTYDVYDSKSGEKIRTSNYGDSISDSKLKARANTVKKNIKSSKVSSKTAKERAKKDLISVAVEEQKKAEAEALAKAATEERAREETRAQQREDKIKRLEGVETKNSLTGQKNIEYVSRERNINTKEQNKSNDSRSNILGRSNSNSNSGQRQTSSQNSVDLETSRNLQSNVPNPLNHLESKPNKSMGERENSRFNRNGNRFSLSNLKPSSILSKQKENIDKLTEYSKQKINSNIEFVKNAGIITSNIVDTVILSPLRGVAKTAKYGFTEVNNAIFPRKIGDETSSVQLALKMQGQGLSENDLQDLTKSKQKVKELRQDPDVQTAAIFVATGALIGGVGVASKSAQTIANPLIKKVVVSATSTAEAGINVAGVGFAATSAKEAITNPTNENIATAIIGGVAGIAGAGGLKSQISNQVARMGAKEVSAETVFNKQVLEGKQTFPTSKSADETFQKFAVTNKGNGVEVVHATPSRGAFGKEVEVKAGPMGAANKEDAILYTTPKGEGSVHFTGVSGESGYSLNPLKAWQTSKPGVISIKASGGVKKLPTEVINSAKGKDFSKVNKYLLEEADKTAVYPTARSTLKHTSELEGGIPQGAKLVNDFAKSKNPIKKLRGYDEYAVVEGKTIPIKKYKLENIPNENANVQAARKKVLDVMEYKKNYSSAIKNKNNKYLGPRGSNSLLSNNSLKNPSKRISENSRTRGEDTRPSPFYESPKRKIHYPSRPGRSSERSSPDNGPSRGTPSGRSPRGSSSIDSGSGSSGGGGSGPPPPPLIPKVPRLPSSEGFKPKQKAGYDIFIRENGKKIKANKQPIPYNMALKQGKNVVDNTIAASFELQKRGITRIPDIPTQIIGNKFRARKTKNALRVVEKSKNRIDTTGEKQGLSAAKFLGKFRL